MKKKFADMQIGEFFFAWGDQISNYDYPKECTFRKIGPHTAVEIEEGRCGMSVCVDERDCYETAE